MTTTQSEGLSPELVTQVQSWLDQDPDEATRTELSDLLTRAQHGDSEAVAAVESAFSGPLTFGTAGLRAALGPGPSRMNRVVVQRAAAGFAAWLRAHGEKEGSVIIGFDARHNSDVFARDTAEIMAGAGFHALLADSPIPTPVTAFAIKHYGAVAGVMVTASHNPPADNGYKVYLGDGSQIVPPTDTEIAHEIEVVSADPVGAIPRGDDIELIGDELIDAYVARAAELTTANPDVTWVYTAMHGVGTRVVRHLVETAGLPEFVGVAEQLDPDPDFPTVAFPNPEEPGAIDLAIAQARRHDADVVIASDPDADRCAVAAVIDGDWRMLTGDELGTLLGDDALRRGLDGVYANSVVSSTCLGRMAKAAGREHRMTLTGFKWIGRVPGLVFGYEEAIGYCCDPSHVPDKDGITALATIMRLVGELKASGTTISERLDEIWATHGLHRTSQLAVRVTDMSIISDAMDCLRSQPPATLLGDPVDVCDLDDPSNGSGLPQQNAIELAGPRVHVVARPSGTEPKLKCYLEVRATPEESSADLPAAKSTLDAEMITLREEMAKALGI
ncbi:phospho-sugar mutase [Cutibacterium avidum]|uniref:phospho-sugar mutase n=1 Tax=Cutibacterium avidum TaxID=33010 RepID=UPI00192C42B8|nr:phospho-sugar mutase [Cutibacterium avidum]MCO6677846.1 phospho-sugar mutase [Cutibacterium avidum]MDU5415467.1 phospho-sugar mutase [Cutibacterium avidum]MDU5419123.1 phospho-sugar mutase [Cutibacterium avidum]QQY11794.1 phospho-sugar mutase [Cutibacterium avidum]